MLRKIEISDDSRAVAARFAAMYREGRVFDKDRPPRLQRSSDLDALVEDIARTFGADIVHAMGEKGRPCNSRAEILHNALFLFSRQVGCTIYMGAYDTDTGTCWSLGKRHVLGCV